jgi:hypothetical protein
LNDDKRPFHKLRSQAQNEVKVEFSDPPEAMRLGATVDRGAEDGFITAGFALLAIFVPGVLADYAPGKVPSDQPPHKTARDQDNAASGIGNLRVREARPAVNQNDPSIEPRAITATSAMITPTRTTITISP